MRFQSFALAATALCFIGPASHAQSFSWDGGDVEGDVIPLPSSIQGAIGRSCVGDFDADGTTDAAYLIGGKIVVLRSPEAWAVVHDTGVTANDIETSELLSGESTPSIVYVTNSGLHELTWSSGAFTSTTIVSGGAWTNAKRVRVRTINPPPAGPGVPVPLPQRFYVGYTQASSQYAVVSREVQGPVVTDRSFSLDEMGGDYVLPIWDATGSPIVAMVCSSKLRLHRLDGTTVRTVNNVGPRGDAVAIVRAAGDAYDRIAWLRRVTGQDDQELFVAGSAVSDQMTTVVTPGSRAFTMRGVDLTADEDAGSDGNLDLVLADQTSWEPRIGANLTNGSPLGPMFDMSESIVRLLGQDTSDASANGSWPAIADFTADRSLDILCPINGGTAFRMFEHRDAQAPRAFWGDQLFLAVHGGANDAGTGIDRLCFELDPAGLTNDPTVTFAYLQVTVWFQDDFDDPIQPMHNFVYHIQDVTTFPRTDGHLWPTVPLTASLNADAVICDTVGDEDNDDNVYWVEIRGRTAPGGFVGSNGPSWNFYFSPNHTSMCDLKTGTTNFTGLNSSSQSHYVDCADDAVSPCSTTQMPEGLPGAWGPRPPQRLSGGTRRLIAPGGQPISTLPDRGTEQTADLFWGIGTL